MSAEAQQDCPHGGYVHTCPPCQRDGPATLTRSRESFGAKTTARYDGFCWSCEDDILPGQRIELAADGWRHVGC